MTLQAGPVVTPEQMRAVDAASPVAESVLIARAGTAVAWCARSMLGGVYGRRVLVLAGSGNNGADGRVAARVLAGFGARVHVIDVSRAVPAPASLGPQFGDVDLVIDAVLGTGFVGTYVAPVISAHTKVLAVDVPSGVDALTGAVSGESRVLPADVTITFAALKPGLLFEPGASLAGDVRVVDIGLDPNVPSPITVSCVDDEIARDRVPKRSVDAHKWRGAVLVVAGSPGMTGAAALSARAAARAGAGLVRLAIPGDLHTGDEIVGMPLPAQGWVAAATAAADRCAAVVVGPGLGRAASTFDDVRAFLCSEPLASVPVLVDGDGLAALTPEVFEARRANGLMVLTPHDGEFTRLTGAAPDADRIDSVRRFAASCGAVVLLKGPTTVVAAPDGTVEIVRAGDQRLATAGSGDVLSGIIGSLLARGLAPLEAASTGAAIHGAAALRGRPVGFMAGDLPDLVADLLSDWCRR